MKMQGPQGPQGPAGPKGDPGAATPVHIYYAENSHEIESEDFQQVVGLTGLPAGTYLFSATIHSGHFCTESNCFFSDLLCDIRLPGEDGLQEEQIVVANTTTTRTIVHTVPDNASMSIACFSFASPDEAALAVGRVYALEVDVVS